MKKAGFISRFIAWLLDGLAISIIAGFISGALASIMGISAEYNNPAVNIVLGTTSKILIITLLLLQFLYFGYFLSNGGKSLGMKIMGIRVVGKDGRLLSFLMGGLRCTVGYWISGLIFGLGYIWAAFDSESQAWHDKIFNTYVVDD